MKPGFFMVQEDAPGAMPQGRRIKKVRFDAGDTHAIGSRGTILGSVGPLENEFGYFVVWDDMRDVPVFVRGGKIEAVETGGPGDVIVAGEVCDFCSDPVPARIFRCYDFVTNAADGTTMLMQGGWDACAECALMIVSERWDMLASWCTGEILRRRASREGYSEYPPGAREVVRAETLRSQKLFLLHRVE